MHVRVLEDFIALARAGSFSRAAEARNSTLPAFSRRIRQLEGEVGAALIDRSQQPLVLTPSGTAFLEAATDALLALRRGRDEIGAIIEAADRRPVRFGVPHTLAQHYFAELAGKVRMVIPSVALQLVITTEAPTLLDIFSSGLCDLIVCFRSNDVRVPLDPRKFEVVRLDRERLVPVSAPDASGLPCFPVPGLTDVPSPLLHQGNGSYLGRVVEKAFGPDYSKLGLELLPLVESERPFPQVALEGIGLVWLPMRAVVQDLAAGRLVYAGSQEYIVPIEIILARMTDTSLTSVDAVWKALSS